MSDENRRFLLAERPTEPGDDNTYALVREPVSAIGEGEALVKVKAISIDPTNRTWISEEPTYLPPVAIGEFMRGLRLGQVMAVTDMAAIERFGGSMPSRFREVSRPLPDAGPADRQASVRSRHRPQSRCVDGRSPLR